MTSLVRSLSFLGVSVAVWACTTDAGLLLGPHDLAVTATLSAVTLAEDCQSATDTSASPCASDSACPSFCQQSSMAIELVAGSGSAAVPFEVSRVRVLTSDGGSELGTLTARSPTDWSGSAYVTWNQTIAPGASLKVSYSLSAPDWSNATSTGSTRSGLSTTYRVEVDMLIDGVSRTLVIDGVTREPPVST